MYVCMHVCILFSLYIQLTPSHGRPVVRNSRKQKRVTAQRLARSTDYPPTAVSPTELSANECCMRGHCMRAMLHGEPDGLDC